MKTKCLTHKLLVVLLAVGALWLTGCQQEEPTPATEGEVLWTDVSGSTLVNTKNIVIGDMKGDKTYVRESVILSAEGRVVEVMLECPAMSAIPLLNGHEDTLSTVEDVTLINKGTITIHTKQIVEHFKNQIQTKDHPDRPYYYLRLLGMFGGNNCTIINEGLIDVYFDHDKNCPFTVYSFAMIGGEGSTITNNGTIRFHGNGSPRTRLRGVGTFGNYVTAVNKGTMESQVDMVEDSRMMTSGGSFSFFLNEGRMIMRQPGRIMAITRYGDNSVINNNLIDITAVDDPEWGTSVVDEEDHCVCAFFEPLNPSHRKMPQMVNNGVINVRIEGTERTHPLTQGYGMFFDVMGATSKVVDVINNGYIRVSQSGPRHFNMAELGVVTRQDLKDTIAGSFRLNTWKTELRDFGQTKDLFLARGCNMDFAGGTLLLDRAAGYAAGTAYSVAPEALLYNAGKDGFIYSHSGYEELTIKAAYPERQDILWDKDNQKVSLTNK